MKYYIKKLGHQELGSVNSSGRPSRGRYIYISKNEEVLTIFPPLSTTIVNDSALLPIIPLYQKKYQKIYCNYIYHNDKFTIDNGTRNEYRIYSNNALEENKYLFKEDDILIIKKDTVPLDGEDQTVYFCELVTEKSSTLYNFCNEKVTQSSIRGFHAVYDGIISEIESKINEVVSSDVNIVIDETVTKKMQNDKELDEMANLFTANTFRDFVMVGYKNLCAISGTVIRYENYTNLEAAHIRPKSHGGLFLPSNGMALCRDLHWAFDKGFYTLDDNYKVKVHPKTTSDYLHMFEGKQILLPDDPFFIPSLDNIHYHNDVVYGLFLTTGRL